MQIIHVWIRRLFFRPHCGFKSVSFSALLEFCEGNLTVTGYQWYQSSQRTRELLRNLMFSLLFIFANCWTNNGVVGDLRSHDAHVTPRYWFLLLPDACLERPHNSVVASNKLHQCHKLEKNIYRSDVHVTFEVYLFTVISNVYRSFIPNRNCIYEVLSYSVDFKAPRELWNPLRHYLVIFTGPAGIVNATVYKTEPNFPGLGHVKLTTFCFQCGRFNQ